VLECNYSKIKDYEKVCRKPSGKKDERGEELFDLNPTTHVISIMMMVIGMSEISQKNWREVWWRLQRYEAVSGALRTKEGKKGQNVGVYLTEADVSKHIGMTTNVGPQKPRGQFVKLLSKVALDKALAKAGLRA
jgi:hypothetical protein